MPCMELFDKQRMNYKKEIIEENSLVVTLEAGKYFIMAKIYKR